MPSNEKIVRYKGVIGRSQRLLIIPHVLEFYHKRQLGISLHSHVWCTFKIEPKIFFHPRTKYGLVFPSTLIDWLMFNVFISKPLSSCQLGAGAGLFLTYATYMSRRDSVVKLGIALPVCNNLIRWTELMSLRSIHDAYIFKGGWSKRSIPSYMRSLPMIIIIVWNLFLTSVHSWAILRALPDWSVRVTWCQSLDQKEIKITFTAWHETIHRFQKNIMWHG